MRGKLTQKSSNNRLPSAIILGKVCGQACRLFSQFALSFNKIGCISEQKNQRVVFLFSQFALSLSPQKNREEVVEI